MKRDLLARLEEMNDDERIFMESLEALVLKNSKNPGYKIAGARVHKGHGDITLHIHAQSDPFPLHRHDFVEMMTVVSGTVTHRIGDQTVSLSVGDILVMNKHISHSIDRVGAGNMGINFIISDSFIGAIAADLSDTLFSEFLKENSKANGEPVYLWFRTAEHKQIGNLLENLAYDLTEQSLDHRLIAKTLSLLMQYLSVERGALLSGASPTRLSERKSEILKYIKGKYRTASLSELSAITYLSEPYLSKLIKELLGKGFSELVLEERMSRAKELLTRTDMPIGTIIHSIGYENESYFHRAFKRRFGTTPLAIRRQSKGAHAENR